MQPDHSEIIAALAEAGRALTKVVSPAGAKQIYEAIEAQRASAARARLPKDLRNVLAEMSVRAARRIGELLTEARLSRGGRPRNSAHPRERCTLGALRLSKNQSSRCQRLAAIPHDIFEAHLTNGRQRGRAPSMASLLKLACSVSRSRAPSPNANGSASAVSASILAADTADGLGDLKDHLLHLNDLVQSRGSAPAEKHAQAVDRRMTAVLRQMHDLIEEIERGTLPPR